MFGASDCEHAGECIVFWFYFLYSVSLISKKRYVFWENLVWVSYIDERIFNSLDILISLSLISLFNHIVLKICKLYNSALVITLYIS